MAENKKGFILYADLIHTINKIDNENVGLLFKHLLAYVNDLNPEPPNLIIEIAFEPIKQQLKRDLKHWESVRLKRVEAGLKSAEIKKQNQQMLTHVENVKHNSTKSTVIVNDNVNVNVNGKVNVIKDINTDIPAFIDFLNYAFKHRPNISESDLKLKYESWLANDWKNGNDKKIKNWKSTLLNTLPYIKDGNNSNNDKPLKMVY